MGAERIEEIQDDIGAQLAEATADTPQEEQAPGALGEAPAEPVDEQRAKTNDKIEEILGNMGINK